MGQLHEIVKLSSRVDALEKKAEASRHPSTRKTSSPETALDPVACNMMVRALNAGFRSTKFARVPSDYYDWALEKRRRFLYAASTAHLTKSLVLRDHRHSGEHSGTQLDNARFVCVVVQYGRKVDVDLLARAVEGRLASVRRTNFRLADACVEVSGYEPNAVTPLGLKTPMPVLVDERIAALSPSTFWLGAGEVDLKWRVDWEEFAAAFTPTVAPLSGPE